MLPTAQRLLRLIGLLQAKRHCSGPELAERLGVDRRSVRRDMERLRELGYPVHASSGVGGGYRLGAGAPALPLLLDEQEATTIAVALRAAAASMAGIEETARRVLTKLDPLVSTRQRRQAGEVHAATATLSTLPSVDAALLGQLAQACRQGGRLGFDYRAHDGTLSQRQVDAQHLVNYGWRWYLLAWDLERDDWRTLRVDRITALQVLPGEGRLRRLPDAADAMVRQAVSRSPYTLRADIRLAGSLDLLSARIPPWCGVLEADGEHHCWLRMGAETPALLASQILSCGQLPLLVRTTPEPAAAAVLSHLAALCTVLERSA